jgi:hypothetical protein
MAITSAPGGRRADQGCVLAGAVFDACGGTANADADGDEEEDAAGDAAVAALPAAADPKPRFCPRRQAATVRVLARARCPWSRRTWQVFST